MMRRASAIGTVLATFIGVLAAAPAFAEDYPTRTVKIVVPYAAGGGVDTLARFVAQALTTSLGQPVIVENRPGGSTIVGAEFVAKANPDGYTLLEAAVSTLCINPALYKELPYDSVKSYAPISLVGTFPMLLVVNKDFPAKSVQDLIRLAKEKPGKLNFASAGIGSTHHLAMEYFDQRVGINLVHVPYRGAAPAVQDVIAGRVPVMFLDVAVATGPLKAGLIRALGVAGPRRLPELPDVPTISESGVPDFEVTAWNGVVAPAGTPAAIVDKLNGAIKKALEDPAVIDKMRVLGIQPRYTTPAQFAAFIDSEMKKMGEVISLGHVTLDSK